MTNRKKKRTLKNRNDEKNMRQKVKKERRVIVVKVKNEGVRKKWKKIKISKKREKCTKK